MADCEKRTTIEITSLLRRQLKTIAANRERGTENEANLLFALVLLVKKEFYLGGRGGGARGWGEQALRPVFSNVF